jgi:hypothetical protein
MGINVGLSQSFIIIYKNDLLWITLVEKTLKTQSIIF